MTEPGVLRVPAIVRLGRGAVAAVGPEAARLGRRALVCTDEHMAGSAHMAALTSSLDASGVEVHVLAAAEAELPKGSVVAAIEEARGARPDVVVGFGGGSCLDLAKLVALGLGHDGPLEAFYGESQVPGPVLPLVGVPTTAGTGSEVTPVAVLSDPDVELKVGISSTYLIPDVAICDAALTRGAPAHVTAHSGIDALAHAIEAYCARRPATAQEAIGPIFVGGTVLTDGHALHAVRRIGEGLTAAVADDPAGRDLMAEGSLSAGLAFGTAGTAAAHALQYPLGARTKTPHGLGVGLLLPYVMAYIMPACRQRLADVAVALGRAAEPEAAVAAVAELGAAIGLPRSLQDIGVERDALAGMARGAAGIERLMRNSPRPMDAAGAEAVLDAAWHGDLERIPSLNEGQS